MKEIEYDWHFIYIISVHPCSTFNTRGLFTLTLQMGKKMKTQRGYLVCLGGKIILCFVFSEDQLNLRR